MKFAVMGGDMRMVSLAAMLEGKGHQVCAWALDLAPEGTLHCCGLSPAGTARGADCVILPLPVRNARGRLNAPLSAMSHDPEELIKSLPEGVLVCGGKPDAALINAAEERGVVLVDYFAREELVALNALATAEGALAILLRSSPITLWESRVLVVGAGRIGKMLASRLRSLGASVTVSARSSAHMAYVRALGCHAAHTLALDDILPDFDTIINTVPAQVLGARQLERISRDALVLDLASAPGGVDFEAAREKERNVIWALGLPAETAPVTAGRIIGETVFNIISERGI